jgi:23S rRNA pseudouridine1911/1915/1917 synthase
MKQPEVIFEDNHLLAIHKPASWLVQGDKTGDMTLLDWGKLYLKRKYNKPGEVFFGCIHRIDRPVSGVVLFAKTSKALERMNALLAKGQIAKSYYAVTDQVMTTESGHLQHYMTKDAAKNKSYVVKTAAEGKLCKLDYKALSTNGKGLTLLRVYPHTGRPHQIRVQLATIGATLIGDLKYGSTHFVDDHSIGLHCFSMSFEHPVTKEYTTISTPPPSHSQSFDGVRELLSVHLESTTE